MSELLAYDTETTCMVDFPKPSSEEHQPHIVQLAAILINDETREEKQSMSRIVKPDGWSFDPEAVAVHGITEEQAMDEGVEEKEVFEEFIAMWAVSEHRLGHNESFDARIIRIATFRYADEDLQKAWKEWKTNAICTMKLSTPIVKCPPTVKMLKAGRKHWKSASLSEAYKHFTGNDLEGAHDAMIDVRASLTVYWTMQDLAVKAAENNNSESRRA